MTTSIRSSFAAREPFVCVKPTFTPGDNFVVRDLRNTILGPVSLGVNTHVTQEDIVLSDKDRPSNEQVYQ